MKNAKLQFKIQNSKTGNLERNFSIQDCPQDPNSDNF